MDQSPKHFPGVERILWVMEQLRHPVHGCPWDKEQTFETIVPYTIEEAYEVADAIMQGDIAEVKDELGDLLFQVVFYARLGEEQSAFDFDAIASQIAEKLIRRHPHVFSDAQIQTEEQLNTNWEAIKRQERLANGQDSDDSILANIPSGMAPMKRAIKLQKRCAKVGFDWPDKQQVVAKINEEVEEVLEAVAAKEQGLEPVKAQQDIESEIGDLLFAILNLARHCKVDPDVALIKANQKFESRFRMVEQMANQQAGLPSLSLEEMETLWQQVKKLKSEQEVSS